MGKVDCLVFDIYNVCRLSLLDSSIQVEQNPLDSVSQFDLHLAVSLLSRMSPETQIGIIFGITQRPSLDFWVHGQRSDIADIKVRFGNRCRCR